MEHTQNWREELDKRYWEFHEKGGSEKLVSFIASIVEQAYTVTQDKLDHVHEMGKLEGIHVERERVRKIVEGKMKSLWGVSDIVIDGKNEPYIAYKNEMYSTDGFIEEILSETLSALDQSK